MRVARAAFVIYVLAVQAFVLYVRFKAKSANDRTTITIDSQFASLAHGAEEE